MEISAVRFSSDFGVVYSLWLCLCVVMPMLCLCVLLYLCS